MIQSTVKLWQLLAQINQKACKTKLAECPALRRSSSELFVASMPLHEGFSSVQFAYLALDAYHFEGLPRMIRRALQIMNRALQISRQGLNGNQLLHS